MKCFHKACSATWAARLRISLFRIGLCREQGYGILNTVRHFGIVIVRTVKHLYSIVNAMLVLEAVHPKSESGKVCRNGRHVKATLSNGVYPQGS